MREKCHLVDDDDDCLHVQVLSHENLWYMDKSVDWDTARTDEGPRGNIGFVNRRQRVLGGASICVRGTLATDLSTSGAALTPGVGINLELDYSNDDFSLHSVATDPKIKYHVHFLSVDLVLTRYEVK